MDKTIAAYLDQGDEYTAAKKYPEAIATYQKAIALRPSVGATSRLGSVYFELEQYPNALAAFQSAVRLNPADATSHLNERHACGNTLSVFTAKRLRLRAQGCR